MLKASLKRPSTSTTRTAPWNAADATASSDLDRCLDSLRTLAGTTGLEAMSGPVERLAEIISGLDVDGRPGAAFGDAVDVVEIDVVLNEIVDAAAWPDEA